MRKVASSPHWYMAYGCHVHHKSHQKVYPFDGNPGEDPQWHPWHHLGLRSWLLLAGTNFGSGFGCGVYWGSGFRGLR